ncbi:MAG: acetolactate decarboxylase [Bacteroidota bacterium]
MKKLFIVSAVFLLLLTNLQAQQGTITQYSTIDALIKGTFDGEMTLAGLRTKGNFGIGTYNSLDGEMILLDNTFYRVDVKGNIKVVEPEEKTPFAAVTFFTASKTLEIPAGTSMAALNAKIDSIIPSRNLFYAVRITGNFTGIRTRSVPAQERPYTTLTEIVKKQPVFSFDSAEGVVLGFRCPPFVSGINVPGYHLHFLKSDRSGGGHVLDFITGNVKVEIQYISSFSLLLPGNQDFYSLDLSKSSEGDIKKVEK